MKHFVAKNCYFKVNVILSVNFKNNNDSLSINTMNLI